MTDRRAVGYPDFDRYPTRNLRRRCRTSTTADLKRSCKAEDSQQTGAHRGASLRSAVARLHRGAARRRSSASASGGSRAAAAVATSTASLARRRRHGARAAGHGAVTAVAAGRAGRVRAVRVRVGGRRLAVLVRAGRRARGAAAGVRGARGVLAAEAVVGVGGDVLADDAEGGVGDVRQGVLERVVPEVVGVFELADDVLPVLLGVLGGGDTLAFGLAGDGPA